jgi:hypothetical protein
VARYDSDNDQNPDVVYCCAGINETVNVELTNVHFKAVIQCNPVGADLGRVLISGSGGDVVWVIISADPSVGGGEPPPGAKDWDGI